MSGFQRNAFRGQSGAEPADHVHDDLAGGLKFKRRFVSTRLRHVSDCTMLCEAMRRRP